MEDGRYGRSREIAQSFGINVSETDPFWKDRTFLDLNYAVSPPTINSIDFVVIEIVEVLPV